MQSLELIQERPLRPINRNVDKVIGDDTLPLPNGRAAGVCAGCLREAGGEHPKDFMAEADMHLAGVLHNVPLQGIVLRTPPVPREARSGQADPVRIQDLPEIGSGIMPSLSLEAQAGLGRPK